MAQTELHGVLFSGRKRRKSRTERKGDEVNVEGEDAQWVRSLQGSQLRLMQALKELGTVRVNTIKVDSLYNCLTPAALRVIGIILEEHVKEQWSLLGSEAPVHGEEKVQKGDFSSADAQQSADNGREVDDVDDMENQKVKTRQTIINKSKSSTRVLKKYISSSAETGVKCKVDN